MNAVLTEKVSQCIIDGFDAYLDKFREITSRAQSRFEQRDWHGIQADHKERLSLYKQQVGKISRQSRRIMGEHNHDSTLWKACKKSYLQIAEHKNATEIAQTFYNSICRKAIGNIGAHPDIMFVEDENNHLRFVEHPSIFRTYPLTGDIAQVLKQILTDFTFGIPYEDIDRDIHYIKNRLEEDIFSKLPPNEYSFLEVISSVFFRNKAAYIVGRLHNQQQIFPFIIPLLHQQDGIFADTLITDPDDASIIFSFTRSYFLVQMDIPSAYIHFLKTIMPKKPYGELYNSIGFNKHGKTEQYRDFLHHLKHSDDLICFSPGIRGLVMAVFELPSYHIVFKLIKDKFDPPKKTDKGMVRRKYRLVSRHDRVGRMADTHEFEHFVLPKDRFEPGMLSEFQKMAPTTVHIHDEYVVIDHVYTERKMTPLNIYLEKANPAEMEEVVDEYGNAIKQLAAANIFAGDMLLKNFGVTRHKRVVFYDYDEIGMLTEYNFRRMPKASSTEELYAPDPWFAIGPKDVFPEEFKHFLIGNADIEEIFVRLHSDLFDVEFWHEMQEKQRRNEILDVYPYRRRQRFCNASGE